MGNANSGRRPQPTALKLLRGNPGKRKPNPREPKPPAGAVVEPQLSAGAAAVWAELAPVCVAMGTLTVADVRVFATLCELQATFTAVALAKGTEDYDARLERETANVIRPYYGLFGLEPVSRARISVSQQQDKEPVSKWAGALT